MKLFQTSLKNSKLSTLKRFAKLLDQGYSIQSAIEISSLINNNYILEEITTGLNKGSSLTQIILDLNVDLQFNNYFQFFSLKNNVSKALLQSIKIIENRNKLINKLKTQLTYPLYLIMFLIIFSIGINYYLMPQIFILFEEFNIDLSITQLILFKIFNVIPIFIILFFVSISILLILTIYAIKTKYYKLLHSIVHYMPFIKIIIKKYFSFKFAVYYNELLSQGYDSSSIINNLLNNTEDDDIQVIVYEIHLALVNGKDIVTSLSELDFIEELFITYFKLMLISVDNKSLNNYINLTTTDFEQLISKSIKYIVPISYLFVGSFVVLVYLSIIIPMMNVVNTM